MDVKMKVSIFFTVSIFSISTVISASVPVLIWGQNGVEDIPTSRVGHTVPSDTFSKIVTDLASENEQNLVLFLQNELSLDDITHNADVYSTHSSGAVYQNLKGLMERQPSTHLPRVESPVEALSALREAFPGNVHHLGEPYSLGDLELSGSGNLIIVNLPESTGQERAQNLRQIDEIIGSVSSDMEQLAGSYSAIYTAATTSQKSVFVNSGRHLLQVEDSSNNNVIPFPPCMLFYSTDMSLTIDGVSVQNNTWKLTNPNTNGSTCNAANASLPQVLLMKFSNLEPFNKLEISMEFMNISGGYWIIKSWTVIYQLKSSNSSANDTTISFRNVNEMFAPLGFSYHCTEPYLVSKGVTLKVADFQVQSYMNMNGTKQEFGRANDCTGFFTIPIWMGIISTAVLVSILSFGIMMLANINSMDRFDDPKGKTITVNVNE